MLFWLLGCQMMSKTSILTDLASERSDDPHCVDTNELDTSEEVVAISHPVC